MIIGSKIFDCQHDPDRKKNDFLNRTLVSSTQQQILSFFFIFSDRFLILCEGLLIDQDGT